MKQLNEEKKYDIQKIIFTLYSFKYTVIKYDKTSSEKSLIDSYEIQINRNDTNKKQKDLQMSYFNRLQKL